MITIKHVKIQLLKITDILTNKTEAGLRLEYTPFGTYSNTYVGGSLRTEYIPPVTYVCFLDVDEIDGFLKVIDYIQNNVYPSDCPDNFIEYNYLSRDDFKGGVYNDNNKWRFYLKLNSKISASQIDFRKDQLDKVKKAILDVQAAIKTIK